MKKALSRCHHYLRLMRFHKPIGIVLLWLPTAWALWIANKGHPSLTLITNFLLGCLCMRALGCVINDVADRHIDRHVERTQERPLTAGTVNVQEALVIIVLLSCAAFQIAIQLPIACMPYAVLALFMTAFYPFCKRFFKAPQIILSFAFSMGIPMAFVASGNHHITVWALLFCINGLWILAYDTTYALMDKADDSRIGVLSTALLFGKYDLVWIGAFQLCSHLLWLYLGHLLEFSSYFYSMWILATFVFVYQQGALLRRPQNITYARVFSLHGWYGLLLWCGVTAS